MESCKSRLDYRPAYTAASIIYTALECTCPIRYSRVNWKCVMKFLYFFSVVIAGRNNVNVTAYIRLHAKVLACFSRNVRKRSKTTGAVFVMIYFICIFIVHMYFHVHFCVPFYGEHKSITERRWKVSKITARFVVQARVDRYDRVERIRFIPLFFSVSRGHEARRIRYCIINAVNTAEENVRGKIIAN